MKSITFLCLAMMWALSGCASMSSRVTERFASVPPHMRSYGAEPKKVYYAAQVALKNVGLQLSRTSIANWSIDGYAPIRSGTTTSDARQTTIEIRLYENDSLETRVEVLVWEQTGGGFPGGVSEQALSEHSLYEIYYTALQQVLQDRGVLKPAPKS